MIQHKNARPLDFETFVQIMSEIVDGESFNILNTDYGRVYINKINSDNKRFSTLHPIKLIRLSDIDDDYDGCTDPISILKFEECDYIALVSESKWLRPEKYTGTLEELNQKLFIRQFLAIYTYACLIAAYIKPDANEIMTDAIASMLAGTYDTWYDIKASDFGNGYVNLLLKEKNVNIDNVPVFRRAFEEYVMRREQVAHEYMRQVFIKYPLHQKSTVTSIDHLIRALAWYEKVAK